MSITALEAKELGIDLQTPAAEFGYCGHCGTPMVPYTVPTGSYNRETGEAIYKTYHKCPQKSNRNKKHDDTAISTVDSTFDSYESKKENYLKKYKKKLFIYITSLPPTVLLCTGLIGGCNQSAKEHGAQNVTVGLLVGAIILTVVLVLTIAILLGTAINDKEDRQYRGNF